MDFLAGNGTAIENYVRRSDRVQTNKSVMTVYAVCIKDIDVKNPGDVLREMEKRGFDTERFVRVGDKIHA
eukprot:CAMPEP_0194446106 /NCGR_PEP_ID=MMETSP0176-20130528/128244_1 /TAXON_ID=216777 /ORGANISM="Proboscia alata, Strain PI-D3" /LENGTH=69 /DNA_ID=CAMNT_0039272757 /DNA_START=166 /DNA_END=374 /DNA_ORIENTATION=-